MGSLYAPGLDKGIVHALLEYVVYPLPLVERANLYITELRESIWRGMMVLKSVRAEVLCSS